MPGIINDPFDTNQFESTQFYSDRSIQSTLQDLFDFTTLEAPEDGSDNIRIAPNTIFTKNINNDSLLIVSNSILTGGAPV